MRITTLGLSELKDQLLGRVSFFQECLVANEIGEIAADKNSGESTEAKSELVKLLNHERDDVRYVTYCWLKLLSRNPESSPAALADATPTKFEAVLPVLIGAALNKFEALAKNAELVEAARARGEA